MVPLEHFIVLNLLHYRKHIVIVHLDKVQTSLDNVLLFHNVRVLN